MNHSIKKLTQAAVLLAICLLSQYFKSLSVYITGPIVNACLLLAMLTVGLPWALVLSVITPVTAFLISGSPIMAAIPLMFPTVMTGNVILTIFSYMIYTKKKSSRSLILGMLAGSICKALFMGFVVVYILLPAFGSAIIPKLPKPEALPSVLATARVTFSVTQLITALIGSLLTFLIWIPFKNYLKYES